jgi:hypothetical protein
MSKNNTHYERAFEDFLQLRRIPYVAVDQAKKAIFSGARVKSFDFILYPAHGRKILVDVKGRKLNRDAFNRGRLGPSWTTIDDLDGLKCWEQVFGNDYLAAFVFAYWLVDSDLPLPLDPAIHRFDQRDYVFIIADLAAYQLRVRPRSPRWHTVYVRAADFAQLVLPFDQFVSGRRPSNKPVPPVPTTMPDITEKRLTSIQPQDS